MPSHEPSLKVRGATPSLAENPRGPPNRQSEMVERREFPLTFSSDSCEISVQYSTVLSVRITTR